MLSPARKLSRRRLLARSLFLGIGAYFARALPASRAQPAAAPRHLVWVWQFSEDGQPDAIGERLRDCRLGIVLKTHDGTDWMAQFDKSPYAASSPSQVSILSGYYEAADIPFHAWAVLRGQDPTAEAGMAADVLASGARSLYLDIDAASGAWSGTPDAAAAFGKELRARQPDASVIAMVDTRPWQLRKLPLAQLAGFCSGIALKQFSRVYDTPEDRAAFASEGLTEPPDGPVPEFLLAASQPLISPLGLPVIYVGEGDSGQANLARFLDSATKVGAPFVSVWRYGIMPDEAFNFLRDNPPAPPAPPPAAFPGPPAPAEAPPRKTYLVQPGDTLSVIAETQNVSVAALVQANNLASPDFIEAGQTLAIP